MRAARPLLPILRCDRNTAAATTGGIRAASGRIKSQQIGQEAKLKPGQMHAHFSEERKVTSESEGGTKSERGMLFLVQVAGPVFDMAYPRMISNARPRD